MWDCYHKRDTGIGDFEERDSGNNHLNELRTGCPLTRIYEEIDILSPRKTPSEQANSIQEAVGL